MDESAALPEFTPGKPLQIGAGPFHLPDAQGVGREFWVAQRTFESRRQGENFTTYLLVQRDHFVFRAED